MTHQTKDLSPTAYKEGYLAAAAKCPGNPYPLGPWRPFRSWKAGREDYHEEERKRLRDWGLLPRSLWPEYELESQPRILLGRLRDDGGWIVQGRDIVKVLKRAKKAVFFGNIILNPTLLRQYASVLRKDWLIVYPANGDGQLRIRTADSSNRATIKHGAGEKYHGLNGFSAQVILQEKGT